MTPTQKMIPTNGDRPDGLCDGALIWAQFTEGEILPFKVRSGFFDIPWDKTVAYCLAEVPEPYVPEPDYSKWVGKPCWFWDDREDMRRIGIFWDDSYRTKTSKFFLGCVSYKHCAPVTADELVKE